MLSESLRKARESLASPERRANLLITVLAAGFAAIASLVLAGMVVLGPGFKETRGTQTAEANAP